MRLIAFLFLSLGTVLPGSTLAKCPFVQYAVEGAILTPTGVKPEEVRVYLFLKDTERTSDYYTDPGQADFAVPDKNGRFRVESWLNTISGYSRLRGERCGRVELEGDLLLIGTKTQSRRTKFKFSQSKQEIRRTLRASAKVAPIELEPLAVINE